MMKVFTFKCFILFIFYFSYILSEKNDSFLTKGKLLASKVTIDTKKCEQLLTQVDHCAAELFYYFNPNLTIYTNKEQMDIDFCR